MNFTRGNDWTEIDGTSLIERIEVAFEDLVNAFGKPDSGDGSHTDAEWILKFEDGTLATIYNYKDGVNYRGTEGTPIKFIRRWSVGGHDPMAVTRVREVLAAAKKVAA